MAKSRFKFEGTTEDGRESTGVLSGDSMREARLELAAKGIRVSHIEPHTNFWSMEVGSKKVPLAELMHLSRQLAAFIRAGVPIFDAISTIADESSNQKLRTTLVDIADSLRSGDSFAAAFASHPDVFPRFYVDMLRAAELTGGLDQVLDQLSRYLERDLEARQKIKSALAYPVVIFVMSIVTVVVLTVFVMPRFEKFFESLDAKLPLITRILIGTTSFLGRWWWAIFGAILLIGLTAWLWIRTESGRRRMDKILLKLPIFGVIIRYIIVERFCRIMAAMTQAGVPLPDAMQVAAEGTNNRVFELGLLEARAAMIEGEGLSAPISRTALFPGSVIQMVRVGEDTGTLDQQLEIAGSFYGLEVEYKIKRMTSLFEPAVITLMGLFVGFVAVAVVSAMYGIFRQIGTL